VEYLCHIRARRNHQDSRVYRRISGTHQYRCHQHRWTDSTGTWSQSAYLNTSPITSRNQSINRCTLTNVIQRWCRR